MLKTQITGAKYLSPQTNQMTNLNIAIPADSKDTEFGTSDILLAKDVVAYLNALDSDISKELDTQTDKINKINLSIKQLIDHNLIKIVTELPTTDIDKNCIYLVPNKDGEGNNVFIEYIYVESKNTFEEVGRIQAKVDLSDYYTKEETDNLILIAKNSAINIHNEDNGKSIKLDINDAEAMADYGSYVNASLTDLDTDRSININPTDGFRHSNGNGKESNFFYEGLYIFNGNHNAQMNSNLISVSNSDIDGGIEINTNKDLTADEQDDGYSQVDLSLTDGDSSVRINAIYGLFLKDNGEYSSNLDKFGVHAYDANCSSHVSSDSILLDVNDRAAIDLTTYNDECSIIFGPHNNPKFKISCPINGTEGATITGVKSLIAFANPSATKVWATDGSTVDLSTKANTSDVLLKKSASGGYYIEENSDELGCGAFAASGVCTASGEISHAEGEATASGKAAHAEGIATASGEISHAEGTSNAGGRISHAEGNYTKAIGLVSHAEGIQTTASGIASHAEGIATEASGMFSHAEGISNVVDVNAIHSIGIGDDTIKKNAEYIYSKNRTDFSIEEDPKNGYKYLIGVGGYDGISTDNTTYKSVQEVIADLTARIEQLETNVRALEAANTPA